MEARGDLARKFLRAAEQRMIAVDFLRRADLNFEAVYLAGYVIECSLKALLLSSMPAKQRLAYADRHFRGRAGHSYESLKEALFRQHVNIPAQIADQLRRSAWSTELRYQVGLLKAIEAKTFIAIAGEVLAWVQRTI